MSSLSKIAFDSVVVPCFHWWKRQMRRELGYYGLHYEDTFTESNKIVKEAIELSSPEVQLGRYRRIKRSMDLQMKNKYFSEYCTPDQWEKYDPFQIEITPLMFRIVKRDREIAALDAYKWR